MEKLYRKKPSGRYEEVPNKLSLNQEILLGCAIRYCMGRRTYVVSSCIEECYRVSPLLHSNFKERVAREIQEAEDVDDLGDSFDKVEWTKLKDFWKPNNKFYIEANHYNTDKWSEHIAFKHNDLYYCLDTRNEYHTVRNIRQKLDNGIN
jgi:hypothetical protein